MRRKDREITDIKIILEIIDGCRVCHLGMAVDDMPYVVPLNFGWMYENKQLEIYFHSAAEGLKIDYLKKNPKVCVEFSRDLQLITGERACTYSMAFESVIGFGQARICGEQEEKAEGLKAIMKTYAPEQEFSFTEKELAAVTVIKVVFDSFTGKRKAYMS